MGLLTVGAPVSHSFACFWDFLSYWVTLSSLHMRAFVLSRCILFCDVCMLSFPALCKINGGRVDLEWQRKLGNGGRGLRGVEEEETVVGMHYIKYKLKLVKRIYIHINIMNKPQIDLINFIDNLSHNLIYILYIFIVTEAERGLKIEQ